MQYPQPCSASVRGVRWMLQEHTIKTEGDLGDVRAKGWQYVVYFIAFEVAIFLMCAQW